MIAHEWMKYIWHYEVFGRSVWYNQYNKELLFNINSDCLIIARKYNLENTFCSHSEEFRCQWTTINPMWRVYCILNTFQTLKTWIVVVLKWFYFDLYVFTKFTCCFYAMICTDQYYIWHIRKSSNAVITFLHCLS